MYIQQSVAIVTYALVLISVEISTGLTPTIEAVVCSRWIASELCTAGSFMTLST